MDSEDAVEAAYIFENTVKKILINIINLYIKFLGKTGFRYDLFEDKNPEDIVF